MGEQLQIIRNTLPENFGDAASLCDRNLASFDNEIRLGEIKKSVGAIVVPKEYTDADFKNIEASMSLSLLAQWEKLTDKAMRDIMKILDDTNEPISRELIDKFIVPHLDRTLGERFYSGDAVVNAVDRGVNRAWKAGAATAYATLALKQSKLNMVDYQGIDWLKFNSRFWLRNRWDEHIRDKIANTAYHMGIEQGIGRSEIGKALARAFAGIAQESAYYWELIGANAVTTARSWANIATYKAVGIKEYQWVTVGDDRVCIYICLPLDGKIFRVATGYNRMLDMMNVSNFADARNIHPWIYHSTQRLKDGKDPYYYKKYKKDGSHKKHYFDKGRLTDERFLSKIGMTFAAAHAFCRCTVMARM